MKFPPAELKTLSHRDGIGAWLNERGLTGVGVEVGTLYGGYAKAILSTWKGALFCVDPWENQPLGEYHDGANLLNMDDVFSTFKRDVEQPFAPRCKYIRAYSTDAANRFNVGELDFVYLDGNHEVNHARADVASWLPKVKVGGLFCGHDFYIRNDKDTNSEAQIAVMAFSECVNQWPQITWCNSWWFVKTQEMADAYDR